MWPFNSKSRELREKEQCEHPEWEDYEDNEMLYPGRIYVEDGELFAMRVTVEQQKCAECGYVDATKHHEGRVYLEVDRVEEVDTDA